MCAFACVLRVSRVEGCGRRVGSGNRPPPFQRLVHGLGRANAKRVLQDMASLAVRLHHPLLVIPLVCVSLGADGMSAGAHGMNLSTIHNYMVKASRTATSGLERKGEMTSVECQFILGPLELTSVQLNCRDVSNHT